MSKPIEDAFPFFSLKLQGTDTSIWFSIKAAVLMQAYGSVSWTTRSLRYRNTQSMGADHCVDLSTMAVRSRGDFREEMGSIKRPWVKAKGSWASFGQERLADPMRNGLVVGNSHCD